MKSNLINKLTIEHNSNSIDCQPRSNIQFNMNDKLSNVSKQKEDKI